MAKKKKSKFKMILKKAAKAALIGGALYAGSKALREPTVALGSSFNRPDSIGPVKSYKVKSDMMKFPNEGLAVGVDHAAGPYERSRIASHVKNRSPIDRRPKSRWNTSAFDTSGMSGLGVSAKSGGRIGAKKGGSVTGIAKRGFGRALMKGKK